MAKFSWKVLAPVSILGIVALGAGAFVFQPWKLFIDIEVDESLPTIQRTPEVTTAPSDEETISPEPVNEEPVVLARGSLISHEYETSGTVKILELADGSRVLRLENLDTSDGPRVEVWLTDAPVIEDRDGWFVFGDANYESLGLMKGNKGNQNYEIPDELDLSEFTSVSLWCVTFSVSFGAAELARS